MIFPTLFIESRPIITIGYQYYKSNKEYKNGSLLLDTLYTINQEKSNWYHKPPFKKNWTLESKQGELRQQALSSSVASNRNDKWKGFLYGRFP